jgi:hypothetical protein
MITNRKFTIAFAICFLLYLLPEIVFSEALIYLSGGVIGGTIKEAFKYFYGMPNDYLVYAVWVLILLTVVFLFYRIQIKPLKYFLILLIAFLLYVVDFIFFEMFPDGIGNYYFMSGIRILLKSLALSWIYYKGFKNAEATN